LPFFLGASAGAAFLPFFAIALKVAWRGLDGSCIRQEHSWRPRFTSQCASKCMGTRGEPGGWSFSAWEQRQGVTRRPSARAGITGTHDAGSGSPEAPQPRRASQGRMMRGAGHQKALSHGGHHRDARCGERVPTRPSARPGITGTHDAGTGPTPEPSARSAIGSGRSAIGSGRPAIGAVAP
jgi:hypothetical protein